MLADLHPPLETSRVPSIANKFNKQTRERNLRIVFIYSKCLYLSSGKRR